MSEAPLDLFLFDLAGTTIRDDGYVLEAFLRTAEAHGLDVPQSVLQARMGWHKQRVFATCLEEAGRPSEPAAQMAVDFERHFHEVASERGLESTPGAAEVLDELEEMGIEVGFTTGFSRATMDMVLGMLGWLNRVSVASTEVAQGRPAPDLILEAMRRAGRSDPSRVGVAGDTPADLEAGMRAGCRIVAGVGCGTHSLEDLELHPHTHLLQDLRPLPGLIRGLLAPS